jgi:hypothetical protein
MSPAPAPKPPPAPRSWVDPRQPSPALEHLPLEFAPMRSLPELERRLSQQLLGVGGDAIATAAAGGHEEGGVEAVATVAGERRGGGPSEEEGGGGTEREVRIDPDAFEPSLLLDQNGRLPFEPWGHPEDGGEGDGSAGAKGKQSGAEREMTLAMVTAAPAPAPALAAAGHHGARWPVCVHGGWRGLPVRLTAVRCLPRVTVVAAAAVVVVAGGAAAGDRPLAARRGGWHRPCLAAPDAAARPLGVGGGAWPALRRGCVLPTSWRCIGAPWLRGCVHGAPMSAAQCQPSSWPPRRGGRSAAACSRRRWRSCRPPPTPWGPPASGSCTAPAAATPTRSPRWRRSGPPELAGRCLCVAPCPCVPPSTAAAQWSARPCLEAASAAGMAATAAVG